MAAIASRLTVFMVGYASRRTRQEVELHLRERFPLTDAETAMVLQDIRRCVLAKRAKRYALLSSEAYYALVGSLDRLN